MLTAALNSVKKFFGISVDVREASKRPLEEEDENEHEGITCSLTTEPQQKKRCTHVDRPAASDNKTPGGLSSVLMQFPWLTRRKEENPSLSSNMNPLSSQMQQERPDTEVTIVEERVNKHTSLPLGPTPAPATHTPQQDDDYEALEQSEARSVSELATRRPPLAHSAIADFCFVPSSMQCVEPDLSAKQKNRGDCFRNSRGHKFVSIKTKSELKGLQGTAFDRPLRKRRGTGILSSRIKHSVVQKSFLHEEKMKYRQLLQQYTEHFLTPSFKTFSHKVSSFSPFPAGMVTRSLWTSLRTKQKQEQIESESPVSSPVRLLSSADNLVLEEALGSKKIVGLEGNAGQHQEGKDDSTTHVPLIDISKEDDEPNAGDKDVIMIKEVLSPNVQRNSLEERLREHPLYDLAWIKSMRKEYEDRAQNAEKNAHTASEVVHELEQKRNKNVSLHDKVTHRLKLLDLTYPSKYTEIQIPDEEEEEAFVPLTSEMENAIDDALNKIPKSEVLIEKFHIQITVRDIKTLDGLNWLNDEVINFYMNLIMDRSQKNNNYPSVYAFNTFFYPKLSKTGYQSVRRWTKKVDIFSHDLLLVPVHLGMHWCMSVVDFKMKCIGYYDSMLGNNDWCLGSLLEYLEAEHQDKKGSAYNTNEWKLENKKDIPQQMNGSDCGMFACKFADYLSRRAKVNFDQQHMPYFRRRMVYEIVTAKLL